MSRYRGFIYALCLALWVGGMGIFTFFVTPAIFGSFDRDTASRVVDALFSGYFYYMLALSALALAAFVLKGARGVSTSARRLPLALLAAAVVLNLYMSFGLYPKIKSVKARVTSFVTEPADSAPRKEFKRLHALSAVINLVVLADGAVLIYLNGRRPE
jgi:uncharacterized membrane protein